MKVYRIRRQIDGLYSCADRYTFSHTGHVFSLHELRSHLAVRKSKYTDTTYTIEEYSLAEPIIYDTNMKPLSTITIKSTNE